MSVRSAVSCERWSRSPGFYTGSNEQIALTLEAGVLVNVIAEGALGLLDLLVQDGQDHLNGGADGGGADVEAVLLHLAHLAQRFQAAHERLPLPGFGGGGRSGGRMVQETEAGDEDGAGTMLLY